MEDPPHVSSQDEDYFSLLDMFVCTRDIIISVCETARLTQTFFRDLLVELYIQVTTISWLSVRSVQRSTQPQPSRVESSLNIFDYLPSWSEVVTRAGHLPPEKEEVVETRAEERIRRALELEANNSKARARLALNKILRLSELKKVSLDDTDTEPNEEEDSDFSLTDFLTSLVGEAAEEAQEEDTDSGPTEDVVDVAEETVSDSFFFHEEKHLELFYIASFLFLSFLVFHIVKKNMENGRKRSRILQDIQRMRRETGETERSSTLGVLRQISLH